MGWFWLKVVERAGFVVDFALDHVKSIAAVAFFIRDNKCSIEDIPFYELHKEIEEHSKEIERRKQLSTSTKILSKSESTIVESDSLTLHLAEPDPPKILNQG
ncbi:hypothetical protein WN943_023721 [Citrus x changshan-huyou]